MKGFGFGPGPRPPHEKQKSSTKHVRGTHRPTPGDSHPPHRDHGSTSGSPEDRQGTIGTNKFAKHCKDPPKRFPKELQKHKRGSSCPLSLDRLPRPVCSTVRPSSPSVANVPSALRIRSKLFSFQSFDDECLYHFDIFSFCSFKKKRGAKHVLAYF